jgi:antitoxin (DNA-binding transcriptional repressor) of toxin-antitoxin stability system
MHIGDFKARFSEVVELIKQGVTIKVVKGKAGELVGYFGKDIVPEKKEERRLGFFSDSGIDIKKEDLQWSDEELNEWGL